MSAHLDSQDKVVTAHSTASTASTQRSSQRHRTRPKLSGSVATSLQSRILSGEWPAGARIPTELDLCDLFGVSRTVVRDAVQTLVAQGLLEVRQGSGTTVAEPKEDPATTALVLLLGRSSVTVGDVLDARAPIEIGLTLQAAERGTTQDWLALRKVLNELRVAVETGDHKAAERLHRRWHHGVLAACHMPALEILLRPLQAIVAVTSLPPRLDDKSYWDVEAHEAVLRSLEEGDADGAQRAMVKHFELTESSDYESLRRTPFHAMRTLEAFDAILGDPTS